MQRHMRASMKIASIYALTGIFWVLFSDKVANMISTDPEAVAVISMVKGWGYVLLTAVLLYWLIQRHMTELGRAEEQLIEQNEELCMTEEELRQQIDEYQNSQNELFEAHKTLNALFQFSPLAIVALDTNGIVTLWNRSAQLLFGWSENDVLGKPYPLVSLENFQGDRSDLEITVQEKSLRDVTTCRLSKSGESIDVSIYTAPMHGNRGEITGIIVMLTDITQRKQQDRFLRESEERYRLLFENMQEGFAYSKMLYDTDGRACDFIYLSVNSAFEELTGLRGVVGKKVTEIFPDIGREHADLIETYGRVVRTGQPERLELFFQPLGIWYTISAYSTGNDHFGAIIDNISSRKKAEQTREATVELLRICNRSKNSRELMRDLLGYFQQLLTCDAVGVRLHEGDDFPYYETRGFPEEFVLQENSLCAYDQAGEMVRDSAGHPAYDCMCGTILSGRSDPSRPFFTARGSFWSNCTTELLASTTEADRQGKTRNRCNGDGYESVALVPLRLQGKTFGLFQFNDKKKGCFTLEKITLLEDLVDSVAIALAKLKIDDELAESNERFRMIFENSLDAIMLATAECDILTANPAACRIFGKSEEEICRAGCAGLMAHDVIDISGLLEELRRTGRSRGETMMLRGDGSQFPAEISSALFSDQAGIQKLSIVIRDVTERLNLETQLRHSQKMEAIGTLAGGIAHDFNNMLAVIQGMAEMSKRKVPGEGELWEHLNLISKAADRSIEITRQLLAFSRKDLASPKPVNLNVHIIETEKTLLRLIGEDIVLTFRPASDVWSVLIDPSQVDQILVNLAVNARDAMAGGGTLVIATENVSVDAASCQSVLDATPGEYVQLSVSDSGVGMEKSILDHIFEPFFTTKEVGKGTGLGLSTVYGIVTQNNGFIKVSSKPGQGTTFHLYLPRLLEAGAVEQETPQTVPSGNGTVLIVEDDNMMRCVASLLLKEIGYRSIIAESPESAIEICGKRDTEIDIILSDVILPGMNGKAMMEEIRKIRPGIKVLFMSGYTADVITQRGVVDEGTNFIQKPFNIFTLNAKLKEALGV